LVAVEPSTRTVGRQALLNRLDAVLGLHGGAAILAGGPGVGKSHLARVVVSRLVAQGAASEVIQGGTATERLPLGPCAHLVPVLTGEVPLVGLIAAALDRQRRQAKYQPMVILAEDADRLDDASATLLGHLIGMPRIAVIATARHLRALPIPLAAPVRDRRLEAMTVGPLGPDAIAELAAQVAGGALDPESAWLLHEATRGNPLWVNEIVRAAAVRGALTPSARGLRLPPDATAGGLYEVLDARLLELNDAERDALSLLAVGGSLPVTTLEAMVGPDVPVGLAAAGLVAATVYNGMAGVRLVHPLYRQVLLQRLSQFEVRLLLRRLIGALESGRNSSGATQEDRSTVIRLALWHAELGQHFDPESLGWAAQTVQWGLLDLVRRHLHGRTGTGPPSPEPVEATATDAGVELGLQYGDDRAAAAYLLASAAWRQDPTFEHGHALVRMNLHQPRHAAEMVGLFEELRPLARTDRQRGILGMDQCIWLYWTSRQRQVALQELETLQAEVQPPWDRMVGATRGGLTLQGGLVGDAMAILDRNTPAPNAPPEAQVVFGSPRAAALIMAGRTRPGVELAEATLPLAYELGETAYMAMGELLISSHWGKLWLSEYEATRASSLVVAELLAGTDDETLSLFLGMAARCLLHQGRPVSAAAELEKAIRTHGPSVMFGFRPLLYSSLVVALAWTGQVAEARAAALEARRWNMPPRFFDADLDLAEVHVLAAEGRSSRAARLAEQTRQRAESEGNSSFAFAAAYLAARLGPTVAARRQLAAAAAAVDLPLARLAEQHVAALLDGDPSDLDQVAKEAVAMDEQLLAVEMLEAAVARAQEGGSGTSNLRIEGALRAQRGRCEQARSPIVNLSTRPTGLTAREREIASLAGGGWTSSAIADELVLSVRTVESHLYRAFAKLGIRSRDELPSALSSRPVERRGP
jgi:DNA-binding CsgD family transcriptional regulator